MPHPNKTVAIVIDLNVTGLGTIRGLAAGGVTIYGILLKRYNSPGRLSRYINCIDKTDIGLDIDKLSDWLIGYACEFDNPPVILPTSDITALMIANHRAQFDQVSHIWKNTAENLSKIVSKDKLYASATSAGVPIPPSIRSTNDEEITDWVNTNPPPYLIKPYYEGADTNVLGAKNAYISNIVELKNLLSQVGKEGIIIQRCIEGGDGHIFDCYGYCDENGQVITMASHQRILQIPKDFGTTIFGLIPAGSNNVDEKLIFEQTEKLLSQVKYHGIFGIEWLQDKVTHELYLIDFNARPFLTIQHLLNCGLNLPLIAYKDLIYGDNKKIPRYPKLKQIYWIDDLRYFKAAYRAYNSDEFNWKQWLSFAAKARSFAVFNIRDLAPLLIIVRQSLGFIKRKLKKLLRLQ